MELKTEYSVYFSNLETGYPLQEQLYNNIIELCNGPCESNQLFILQSMQENQDISNMLERYVKDIESPIYSLKQKHIEFLLCELEGHNT